MGEDPATPQSTPVEANPRATYKKARLTGGMWFVTVFLVLLLLASLAGLAAIFLIGRFPAISFHGWVAMGLGTVLSLILGIGLMWLSFYSARHGFDDRADPGRRSQKS